MVVVGDHCCPGAGLDHFPADGVDAAVVESAQEDQVVGVGLAAVGPVDDVVCLGPGDRAPAAGPGAAFGLFEFELPAQRRVGEAGGPAEFDGLAALVVEDRGDDTGFAGEETGLGDRDRPAFEEGQAAGVLALEGLDVDREVEGGGVAVAGGGFGGGAVSGEELVEGLGVAVRLWGKDAVLV
nr:hypothetical protein [Glycomyces albidus]